MSISWMFSGVVRRVIVETTKTPAGKSRRGCHVRGWPSGWRVLSASLILVVMLLGGCRAGSPNPSESHAWPKPSGQPQLPPAASKSLSAANQRPLYFGTAVSGVTSNPALADKSYTSWLGSQFTSVTPENQMKWGIVHPTPSRYDFSAADQVVAFAREHGQGVRGHTLLWHGGNPGWVKGLTSCDDVRRAVKDHIATVVGRYRGIAYEWDVANEVLNEDGKPRDRENPFIRACGMSIVSDAFRWAHEADPLAVLFLSDFDVEGLNAKSDAYYSLAQHLLADGVPLGGFASQTHLSIESPIAESFAANFARFGRLGLRTAITEADVRMPLAGPPTAKQLTTQAEYYGSIARTCVNEPSCSSFTVWGFTDKYSWLSQASGEGAATLLTAEFATKPAYVAVAGVLKSRIRR